jgi:hypothetical protein
MKRLFRYMLFVYYLICITKVGETTFGFAIDTSFVFQFQLIIVFVDNLIHLCCVTRGF